MKKYRLKQWYPSLPENIKVGDVITFCYGEANWLYHPNSTIVFKILKNELDNPDFWELLEEPLVVTEDGVEVFDRDTIVYNVRNNASAKIGVSVAFLSKYDFEHKVFFHESNADEYIWRNKRVFSYNDLRSWDINGGTQEEALKVAKERSKE